MSNPFFNAGDELASAHCDQCGDVLWVQPDTRRVQGCLCGMVLIGPDGVDERSPNQNPTQVAPGLLQQIFDYEYEASHGQTLPDPATDPLRQQPAREHGNKPWEVWTKDRVRGPNDNN